VYYTGADRKSGKAGRCAHEARSTTAHDEPLVSDPHTAREPTPGGAPAASERARDAGVLVFGRVIATLSDALLPIVIVRLLGKADVGVLTSVLLLYNTVALILSTGFPAALLYHLTGKPLEQRRAISVQVALGLLGFGAAAALAIGSTGLLQLLAPALAARLFDADSAALVHGGLGYLFLLAAFPLGDLPARMAPNLLVAEHRTDLAARYAIARSIGNALFVLVPASTGAGIAAVLFSYSLFGLLQGLALAFFIRLLYRGAGRARSPIRFAQIVRFALPLGMTDIVSMLSTRLDRFVISLTYPVAAFAEYQAGAFQIPILTTIAYTVGTVYAPEMTALITAGRAREAIAIWRESIAKVALVVVPCAAVFVVAAEEVVVLLFTESYLGAAPVLRCYAVMTMTRVAAFGTVVVSAGKPGFVLRAAGFTLLAFLVLTLPGLQLFGFVGPAIAAAAAYVPMVVIYCYYIARALGLRMGEIFPLGPYLQVLALTALAAVPAVALKQLLELPPVAMLGVVTLSLLGSFLALGLATGRVTRGDLRYAARFVRFGG
jgi:O-antigen/teichoic acid export membrane protein